MKSRIFYFITGRKNISETDVKMEMFQITNVKLNPTGLTFILSSTSDVFFHFGPGYCSGVGFWFCFAHAQCVLWHVFSKRSHVGVSRVLSSLETDGHSRWSLSDGHSKCWSCWTSGLFTETRCIIRISKPTRAAAALAPPVTGCYGNVRRQETEKIRRLAEKGNGESGSGWPKRQNNQVSPQTRVVMATLHRDTA